MTRNRELAAIDTFQCFSFEVATPTDDDTIRKVETAITFQLVSVEYTCIEEDF